VERRRLAHGVRDRLPALAACLPTMEMAKYIWQGTDHKQQYATPSNEILSIVTARRHHRRHNAQMRVLASYANQHGDGGLKRSVSRQTELA